MKKMSFEEKNQIKRINFEVINKFFDFKKLEEKFKIKNPEVKLKGIKI